MSQLAAVDISDSDRFELAEVLKEESESSSAPRPLEDILQETCDDVFDPMSQRSCYELLSAYIARPTATIVSKNGHSSCSNCGAGIPYHTRFAAYCLGCAHRDPRELRGGGGAHAVLRRQEEELDLLPAVHANLQSGPPRGPTFCPHPHPYLIEPFPRWAPWLDGAPCWEIEHTDIAQAVDAKCPIEMSGYDSLEQLQRVWNTRRPDGSASLGV